VPHDASHHGFHNVLEMFEALAAQLRELRALHALDGADPTITHRIDRAAALADKGLSLARQQVRKPFN